MKEIKELYESFIDSTEYGRIVKNETKDIEKIYNDSGFGDMYCSSFLLSNVDSYTSDQGLTYPTNEFNVINNYVMLVGRLGLELPNNSYTTNTVDGITINLNYGFDNDTNCGPMLLKLDMTISTFTFNLPYYVACGNANSQVTLTSNILLILF